VFWVLVARLVASKIDDGEVGKQREGIVILIESKWNYS
jgi:hypothetical protein